MILTPKQDEAVRIIDNRYKSGEAVTTVSGFAGTGKSTIIKHFIDSSDLWRHTKFVTYTGKASLVLQRKGLPATTIHRLIYNSFLNPRTGKFSHRLKPELDGDIRLIIVDEVSMVSRQLLIDLLSFNVPIVTLGDSGQLEPIGEDNGLLKSPDVFLEEIHRQAQENTIIRLSMAVREGKSLSVYKDDFVQVLERKDLNMGMLDWADQVICARNDTRRALNQAIRTNQGKTDPLPVVGDKMICLRNYWDHINEEGTPLINGTIGNVSTILEHSPNAGVLGEKFIIDFATDFSDNPFTKVSLDTNIIKGIAPQAGSYPFGMGKMKQTKQEFDYGYVITGHKSQGSEWDKVLVVEEMLRADSHRRWLYTVITRASEKLVLIKR